MILLNIKAGWYMVVAFTVIFQAPKQVLNVFGTLYVYDISIFNLEFKIRSINFHKQILV